MQDGATKYDILKQQPSRNTCVMVYYPIVIQNIDCCHTTSLLPIFHQVEPGTSARTVLEPFLGRFIFWTSQELVSTTTAGSRATSLHRCMSAHIFTPTATTLVDYVCLQLLLLDLSSFIWLLMRESLTRDLVWQGQKTKSSLSCKSFPLTAESEAR